MARQSPTPADFPFVQQIKDEMTQTAVRILNSKLAELVDTARPLRGTLIPDEKPLGLGVTATNLLFYSTDFNRVFRWAGENWEDAPGQDPRNMIAWFAPAGPPGTILTITGWAICTGKDVQQSQADGTLVSLKTPVIPTRDGLMAYIRL